MTTAAQRDRQEDLAEAAYEAAEAEILSALRAEWDEEFGADNPRFPFRPDGAKVHVMVMDKLRELRDE
jgi:hypothetical protein